MHHLAFYYKDDCAPCAAAKPIADAIAAKAGVELLYLNAEADLLKPLVANHKVKAVPTLVVVDATGARIAGFYGKMIEEARVLRFLGV